MKSPAWNLRRGLSYKTSSLVMDNTISIFDFNDSKFSNKIYLTGICNIIKELFIYLGGVKQVSMLLNQKYSKIKEWPMGRKPISLFDLNSLLDKCDLDFAEKMKTKVNAAEIYLNCRYSSKKIKLPKYLSADLAYVVGLILGDGSLAGDSSNKRGNWTIGICFENKNHLKIYNKLIMQVFEVCPKNYLDRGCVVSVFSSRVLHWFFREYFEFYNGYKSNKIFTPQVIKQSNDNLVKVAFLQGLFDSDGTFTNGRVKYGTTSQKMAYQVQVLLNEFGINSSISSWQKKHYHLLYVVAISARSEVQKFSRKVGFRHPNKKLLLLNFIDSSIV
jgi:hypothetical protein